MMSPIGKFRRFLVAVLPVLIYGCAPVEAEDIRPDPVEQLGRHHIENGETLMDVARRYDLGFVELRVVNLDVDVWRPEDGTPVRLPRVHLLPDAAHEGIVVNLAEMRLYYFPEDDQVPKTYPLGIGREGRLTPTGDTKIVRKQADPTWYPPASIRKEKPDLPKVVPPGPDNPLGEHALYFDWPEYLIHGTNKPDGVGRQVSSGCLRMYPEDVAELFELVPVGTPVTVVDQPVKVAKINGAYYLEIHPSPQQADEIEFEGTLTPAVPEGLVRIVLEKVGEEGQRVDWNAVREAGVRRQGVPVRISRPVDATEAAEQTASD